MKMIPEARGIVGSQDGVKPHEILLRPENVDVFFAGRQDALGLPSVPDAVPHLT